MISVSVSNLRNNIVTRTHSKSSISTRSEKKNTSITPRINVHEQNVNINRNESNDNMKPIRLKEGLISD